MDFCPRCGTRLVERDVHGRARPACLRCGFIYYAGPKVAVGVVVWQSGGILLNRRAIDPGRGRWSFPSGYVDLGESTESAAIREVKEETGLDVRLAGLVGVYSSAERPVVFVVYAGEITGGEPASCDEVEATETFALDSLPDMAFEHDRRIISDWRSGRWEFRNRETGDRHTGDRSVFSLPRS